MPPVCTDYEFAQDTNCCEHVAASRSVESWRHQCRPAHTQQLYLSPADILRTADELHLEQPSAGQLAACAARYMTKPFLIVGRTAIHTQQWWSNFYRPTYVYWLFKMTHFGRTLQWNFLYLDKWQTLSDKDIKWQTKSDWRWIIHERGHAGTHRNINVTSQLAAKRHY